MKRDNYDFLPTLSRGDRIVLWLSLLAGIRKSTKCQVPLILDSPFSHLDIMHRTSLIDFLKDTLQGGQVICIGSELEFEPVMVTLTGSHASPKTPQKGGLRHMAYLGKFHEAHHKAKDLLRKYLKTDLYLAMLEGHPESGYVHAHNLYFLNECPTDKTVGILENHWNNNLGMGSAEHGIKIKVKEPHDFRDIKSFIAYPMSYVGKTSVGALAEWSKYDVVFNTCLWLSPRPVLLGGVGHRVRAFQPSRALSKIMNPHESTRGYCHIETVISGKKRNDPTVMYQAPSYDVNIKVWKRLGGDAPMGHMEERPVLGASHLDFN